jgi:FAD/FMN-containing dehydrogenase
VTSAINWSSAGRGDDPAQQEACIQWAREFHDALAPHAATNRNLNFTVVEEQERSDRVRASYGDNYDRLKQIKQKYDPGNFFRVNNNIPPAE